MALKRSAAILAIVALLAAFTAACVVWKISPKVSTWTYWIGLGVLTAVSFTKARFDRVTVILVTGGLALYLAYLGYTDYGERNYDGGAQLEYIEYIVKHHVRPPAAHCLVCHHPPLYYALGAGVYAFFSATKLAPATTGLQIFSLLLTLVFVGYGAATARLLARSRRELHLAVAFIVLWPYSIHNAVRLHNDTLASTLMAAALYHTVRWGQREKPRDLYLASVFAALALLTKSSAYAVAAALGFVALTRFFRSRDKLRFVRRGLVAAAILAAGVVLNARGKESPTSAKSPLCHKILGTACDINKGQWVENEPRDYVYLDLPSFLKAPYALADRDDAGRKYFWNHFLKSSLFGTHNTTPDRKTSFELNRVLAYGMNALLLGMLAYLIVVGAIFARRRAVRRFGVAMVCLASFGLFMAGFRALIPAPHHTDFRHVFAAVILMSILYAAAAGRARAWSPRLEAPGRVLATLFLVLSVIYFFPKHDLAIRLTRRVVHHPLAAFAHMFPEGSAWDMEKNLIIEENHIVQLDMTAPQTVNEVDVSFDNNDRYEIVLVGDTRKALTVGPTANRKGLVRYVRPIEPPVHGVHAVRIRPVSGDMAYSMGHFILK